MKEELKGLREAIEAGDEEEIENKMQILTLTLKETEKSVKQIN